MEIRGDKGLLGVPKSLSGFDFLVRGLLCEWGFEGSHSGYYESRMITTDGKRETL